MSGVEYIYRTVFCLVLWPLCTALLIQALDAHRHLGSLFSPVMLPVKCFDLTQFMSLGDIWPNGRWTAGRRIHTLFSCVLKETRFDDF